jgi:hypothetical protein
MSTDLKEVIDTLKQIIRNCIVDDIDIDKLAMFDIEYIFINIRKVSVSDVVELIYNDDEDRKIPFTVNLEDVKVKFNPDHNNNIQLSEGLGIKLKYPDLDTMLTMEYTIRMNDFDQVTLDDSIFDMIIDCIDSVYDDEKAYRDFSREEASNFLLSLKVEDLNKIQRFFATMPAVEHTVLVNTGSDTKEVTLRGIKDFFTF